MTPSWLFLVLRFALYAGCLAAFIFGLVDGDALDKLVGVALSFAAGASGFQAMKAAPKKAQEAEG